MKYTKEKIDETVKKLLADIERPYFKNMPFKIEDEDSAYIQYLKKTIKHAWRVAVYVQEDQFRDKDDYSVIVIIINDDTGAIESYADLSCGRPVPSKARLNSEGKYELVQL